MGEGNSKSCIFCEIRDGKRESKGVYRDDKIFAFHDINKHDAREHILICPIEHIRSVKELDKSHLDLLNYMHEKGKEILNGFDPRAEKRIGFHEKLQMIDHLHLHCALGPFEGLIGDKIFYGWGMRSIEEQTEIIKKKEDND